MGSRGRSIRLRIGFLVAIPLVTMLGLFGYVAYTSINNWLNLDRAPSLIQATSEPLTNFVTLLQAERRAAIVYESAPTAANLAAFRSAVTTTNNGLVTFEGVVSSPATTGNATPGETVALAKMVKDVTSMNGLRAEVTADKLSTTGTLQAYSQIIADQDTVFQAQAASISVTLASSEGLGLISAVNAREDLSEQDAVLAGALAANSLTGAERAVFGLAYGRQFEDTQLYERLLSPTELNEFNVTFNQMAPTATIQDNLTKVQDAVTADIPLQEMQAQGLTPATWQLLTSTSQKANFQAATNAATDALTVDLGLASSAKDRVWETAGVGAVGLILTVIVSVLLSLSIIRRLATLRRTALTLAREQLPSVVARLRRGESVDVAAEAPSLSVGSDEIGQVGQAIDTVRQTAIRSAIDEARVRQGVNDMFRNLARRNQSLLQRQLTVLDEAERRTTDPDVLDDLFRMDHLTTRMRRHAEGLIILSGAPPGRSWSAPVRLVDVMRGAVAEVEDYARVSVVTQARVALSGSAVTDVIHLLAELIENATTLSPPNTPVRVTGELVANGFAIEIEDRGLGITPERQQELNERLVNPPDINPANTEQLGLFVVGQLAKRHGIRITLRPSPFGGTTAVTLIPPVLIVEDTPALTAGATNGSRPGNARPGPTRAVGWEAGAGPAVASRRTMTPAAGHAPAGAASAPRDLAANGHGTGPQAAPATSDPSKSSFRIGAYSTGGYAAGGRGTGQAPARPGAASGVSGTKRGRHGNDDDDVPVVTGVPVTRATAAQPELFDVFAPLRRADQDTAPPSTPYPPYPDFGGQPDASSGNPYADPSGPSYQGDGVAHGMTGPVGNIANIGNNGGNGSGKQGGDSADKDASDAAGLPRRVRQANLAPQLRASTATGPQETAPVPQATAASLTDMRNTLSAMQRGWQQGRSETERNTEGNVDG